MFFHQRVGRKMKPSKDSPLLAAICQSRHRPFPWWIFQDLRHCSRELTALFLQLDAEVISAVASKKQSTANTGLGRKVKREQTITQKLSYCFYL